MTRRPARAALAAIAIVVLAACSNDDTPHRTATPPSGDSHVTIGGPFQLVVDGSADFSPNRLELPGGRRVTIEIRNEDDRDHDFAVSELDLQTDTLRPGEVTTVELVVPDETVEFLCTLHYIYMVGVIVPT